MFNMQIPSVIIRQMKEMKKNVEFMPTGFVKLDDFLDGGFLRKELIVLGAYTGFGKSFFAGKIFFNIASIGFNAAYFSLEISNAMIISRLLGSQADIKPTRFIAGLLTHDEHNRRIEAEAILESLDSLLHFYDDLYDFDKIKLEIINNHYDFVVIDFIQNMITPQRDEYERLSFLSLQFQQLAKETNACILLLSQLSNEAARRGALEYKGSGSIAMVCDLGFFLARENTSEDQKSNNIKLILRKNRRGISGKEFEFIFRQPGGGLYEKK